MADGAARNTNGTNLPEVRASLDRIEASTLQLQTYRRGAGVLNISVLPTFGAKWLVPRLTGFFCANPGVLINFYTEIKPFEFANSEIDAAIHFGSAAWTDVIAHRLLGERLIPVCSPKLLDGQGGSFSPDGLARFPLLQLMPLPDAWGEWFHAAGVRRQISVHGPRFEHFSMAIEAAVAGFGVLLVPDFLVIDDVRSGKLVVPHHTSLRTNMAYYLIYPTAKRTLPWLRLFRDWLLVLLCHKFLARFDGGLSGMEILTRGGGLWVSCRVQAAADHASGFMSRH